MSIALFVSIVLLAAATLVGVFGWSIVARWREAGVGVGMWPCSGAAPSARATRPLVALMVTVGSVVVLASPAAAAGTGAITGTVTNNAASPVPLASICVQALNASTGSSVGSTTTNASGQYTLSGLQTGSYKVDFHACGTVGYVEQYYNNKPTLATATAVSVTAPSTKTGVNAKMVLGGTITGTVTNSAALPKPLPGICIQAFNASTGSYVGSGSTDASGQYSISRLATGAYKLEFGDCSSTGYITQYYNNKPDIATANAVSVTAPSTKTGVNVTMVQGGKITGNVTDNAAVPMPLAGMCVVAFHPTSFTPASSTKTGVSGNYVLRGLATGSYKVEFYDCNGTDYIGKYYNNKADFNSANLVSVTTASTTPGISTQMVLGGKISGTVTDNAASPAPLANICVQAFTAAGSFVVGTSTTATGQYTMPSIPAGSYKVEFSDCQQAAYITQYYKNQPSLATANSLKVAKATTTTAINAKMVHS
jgi:Carboxypeptidase regulatory-like domain